MKLKNNSLVIKTFIYLLSYSAIILILLWLFQIVFLNIFYERYQYKKIDNLANKIIKKSIYQDLEQDIYDYGLCAQVYSSDNNINYNIQNKNCILNSSSKEIIIAKNKIFNSNNTKTLIKVINPKYDSKSLIYGVRINEELYVILNTQLEDVDSTTSVLKSELIYITLITIILSGIVSIIVSKMINKPILSITRKAKKMGEGNFTQDKEKYNIAEIDELAETLNYARSELRNMDELKQDLIANVSHDLKTPLTMIKAYAEMAKDINANDKKKREEDLDIIIKETDRLTILVNDILDLSKLEKNKNELNIEEYDLIEELNEIIKRYKILQEKEHYTFILHTPKIAIVKADKNKINQVLYNLINNAINYTGNDLTIIINIKEEKNKYLVEIIDSGKGIKKEDIPLIWTKYYKSEKNHKRNIISTGLGLSIVKNILQKHGFNYGVKSEINKGSNFYFEIKK